MDWERKAEEYCSKVMMYLSCRGQTYLDDIARDLSDIHKIPLTYKELVDIAKRLGITKKEGSYYRLIVEVDKGEYKSREELKRKVKEVTRKFTEFIREVEKLIEKKKACNLGDWLWEKAIYKNGKFVPPKG